MYLCGNCQKPLYLIEHWDTHVRMLSHMEPSAHEFASGAIEQAWIDDEEERCRAREAWLHGNPCRVIG